MFGEPRLGQFLDEETWPNGQRFFAEFRKTQKSPPDLPHKKKKTRNLRGSGSAKNSFFRFRTLAKIFPLPTSEVRGNVRRGPKKRKKGNFRTTFEDICAVRN